MDRILRRALAVLLSAALLCPLLSGCARTTEMSTTIFAMDTVMTLRFYGQGPQDKLELTQNQLVDTIYQLQNALNVNDETSDLYALNHAAGQPVTLSPSTMDLLRSSLHLCQRTGGALDISAHPAIDAWGFSTGEYRVPGQEELEALADTIDYTRLALDQGQTAVLPEGMALNVGAVAKGYAGDWLKQTLIDNGISSALLDLGQSSIQTIGSRPDGSPWRIGIQDPVGEGYLGVLELSDRAMGTSGSYQRYFEEDGVRYCHIIDPNTAAPARSGLAGVTVVGNSCMVCDGLSTALFVMGLEEATRFWDSCRADPALAFDAIFIGEDGSITVTEGLADAFSLADGQTHREVSILS